MEGSACLDLNSAAPCSAAFAPFAGSGAGFIVEEPAKIMLILEPALVGDFFGGKSSFGQQRAGAGEAQFEQILMGTETGVVREFMTERSIALPEFTRELVQVDGRFEVLAHAIDGAMNDGHGVVVGGQLGVLIGIEQA